MQQFDLPLQLTKVPYTKGFDGDLIIVSQDASVFREGTHSNLTGGTRSALYTLVGNQTVMKYWSHNVAIDASGNFNGRDATGTCALICLTESNTMLYFGAVTGPKGSLPVFTLSITVNVNTGAVTVPTAGLNILNPAGTFAYTITSAAIAAARILNLPLTTATDTLACLGLAQTFTGANSMLMAQAGLTIQNPAATFNYTIQSAAIAAARTLNLPLLAANDTLAVLGLAQTFTALQTNSTNGAAISLTGAAGSLLLSGASAAIGFATGAGGAVTQATSKVTAFTLSRPTGNITFAADALAADTTTAGAVWTNTVIAATDLVVFTHVSGGTLGAYTIACTPAAGSATVFLRNVTPGSLTEAPVFKFAVIKAVIA
jgi:hypothetical protein